MFAIIAEQPTLIETTEKAAVHVANLINEHILGFLGIQFEYLDHVLKPFFWLWGVGFGAIDGLINLAPKEPQLVSFFIIYLALITYPRIMNPVWRFFYRPGFVSLFKRMVPSGVSGVAFIYIIWPISFIIGSMSQIRYARITLSLVIGIFTTYAVSKFPLTVQLTILIIAITILIVWRLYFRGELYRKRDMVYQTIYGKGLYGFLVNQLVNFAYEPPVETDFLECNQCKAVAYQGVGSCEHMLYHHRSDHTVFEATACNVRVLTTGEIRIALQTEDGEKTFSFNHPDIQ